MAKEKEEKVCTGCGRKLGVVKYKFDSIPGGVFCKTCYEAMKNQVRGW